MSLLVNSPSDVLRSGKFSSNQVVSVSFFHHEVEGDFYFCLFNGTDGNVFCLNSRTSFADKTALRRLLMDSYLVGFDLAEFYHLVNQYFPFSIQVEGELNFLPALFQMKESFSSLTGFYNNNFSMERNLGFRALEPLVFEDDFNFVSNLIRHAKAAAELNQWGNKSWIEKIWKLENSVLQFHLNSAKLVFSRDVKEVKIDIDRELSNLSAEFHNRVVESGLPIPLSQVPTDLSRTVKIKSFLGVLEKEAISKSSSVAHRLLISHLQGSDGVSSDSLSQSSLSCFAEAFPVLSCIQDYRQLKGSYSRFTSFVKNLPGEGMVSLSMEQISQTGTSRITYTNPRLLDFPVNSFQSITPQSGNKFLAISFWDFALAVYLHHFNISHDLNFFNLHEPYVFQRFLFGDDRRGFFAAPFVNKNSEERFTKAFRNSNLEFLRHLKWVKLYGEKNNAFPKLPFTDRLYRFPIYGTPSASNFVFQAFTDILKLCVSRLRDLSSVAGIGLSVVSLDAIVLQVPLSFRGEQKDLLDYVFSDFGVGIPEVSYGSDLKQALVPILHR